jgi:hypothetical protein
MAVNQEETITATKSVVFFFCILLLLSPFFLWEVKYPVALFVYQHILFLPFSSCACGFSLFFSGNLSLPPFPPRLLVGSVVLKSTLFSSSVFLFGMIVADSRCFRIPSLIRCHNYSFCFHALFSCSLYPIRRFVFRFSFSISFFSAWDSFLPLSLCIPNE